ncbi:MAG: indolepyruvate ferredoxin oxidoreductase family protein [Actinomycetota bacterium]
MALIDDYDLRDRYRADDGRVFLSGIQALARLPLEQLRADRRAGRSTAAFVSGYQGSPLGGYGDEVQRAARVAADLPLVFRPGMNEEYAATAVMGSQLAATRPDARYDGVVGVWYGKAPGVDRAADALRHAVYAGTSMLGGAVALVGDDPAAKSSTVPSSSAGLVADMHMPLLYPGDPDEALLLGRHAIALSRGTGLWCALKVVADVADATASVDLDPDRVQPVIPLIDGRPYEHIPDGRLLTPRTVEVEREIVEVRYELARRYAADNELNEVVVDAPDPWIGIVSSGITYREVREALARLGLRDDAAIAEAGIRLLRMRMPMPFDPATMRRFAAGLEQVFVIEEKQPNIESLIKDALYPMAERPLITGKADRHGKALLPAWGGLDADDLVPVLYGQLQERLGDRLAAPVTKRSRIPVFEVERSPFFCSGCPHNRSTEVAPGTLVGAGIGCHTMVLLMDDERVGDIAGLACMGNEGTQWIGMSDFVETDHLVQNLGDGTFFHSGQLAIQAAVAADVNLTYKLLYNGTVAMTGGQDPEGALGVADIATVLLRQGVREVVVTTDDPKKYDRRGLPGEVAVVDRTRLVEEQERLARTPGVTVLIHDQACAAEARRARKRGLIETPNQRVVINPRICEGCGDCGQTSNCLSVQPVETEFGRKTRIDQTSCNLDYSCLEGDCPSFMTVTYPEEPAARTAELLGRMKPWRRWGLGRPVQESSSVEPTGPPIALPDPEWIVPVDEFSMRITGIGGTGVVTVAQILGTAAMFGNWQVRGLDQIGLSQKAGPVVSDVRLSRAAPSFTNRLGRGQADLLLAFDQLVGVSARGLDVTDHATVVVGSTSTTPTGAMIGRPDLALPQPSEMSSALAEVSTIAQHWADAQAITSHLFGSAASANLLVVGMAVQAGALPIEPDHIERAIQLNGVQVDVNEMAFRWGRAIVVDPTLVPTIGGAAPNHARAERWDAEAQQVTTHPALQTRIAQLAAELESWGDSRTARTYLDRLEGVVRRSDDDGELVAEVGEGLFQLTAYKDEYEVARLMTDERAIAEARELAGAEGRLAWKLHPPALRAIGLDRKVTIDESTAPAIRLLARGKRLRGTVLDPFGWAKVRRVERRLPTEYVDAVLAALAGSDPDRIERARAVASAADLVRGYEHIKMEAVERFRSRIADA